jgi:hypothetical protein
MRDSSIGLAILLTLTLTPPALADYIIRLKNGRTLETPGFWEERGEIKFQWAGGVASLSKKDLLTITEAEKKLSDQTPNGEKQPAPENPEDPPGAPLSAMNIVGKVSPAERLSSAEGLRGVAVEHYRKQKAYYTKQFEQAYQRYLEASSRRDAEGKKKAWEEFNRFGGQVIALEIELKRKNNGALPSWWKEEKNEEGK